MIHCAPIGLGRASMARQAGLLDIDVRLAALSAKGDALEKLTSKAFGQFWNGLVHAPVNPEMGVCRSFMC